MPLFNLYEKQEDKSYVILMGIYLLIYLLIIICLFVIVVLYAIIIVNIILIPMVGGFVLALYSAYIKHFKTFYILEDSQTKVKILQLNEDFSCLSMFYSYSPYKPSIPIFGSLIRCKNEIRDNNNAY